MSIKGPTMYTIYLDELQDVPWNTRNTMQIRLWRNNVYNI